MKSREKVMSLRLALGVLLAITFASSQALACKGREVLFEEKFQEEDPGWSEVDGLTISGGRAEFKPKAGYHNWSIYGGAAFSEADICVDLVVPSFKEEAVGGFVFWSQGRDNFYAFRISTAQGGHAQILRLQGQNWLTPVAWRKAPSLKVNTGAANQLRVTVKGNEAQTFINDRPFVKLKGVAPLGAQIGLYASSEEKEANGWVFTSVVVTKLP
jgi:hypothetical protein